MPKEPDSSKPTLPDNPTTPGRVRAMNVSKTLLTVGPDRKLFPPNTVAELSPDEVDRFSRRNLISVLG